jgi:hypothetical protein
VSQDAAVRAHTAGAEVLCIGEIGIGNLCRLLRSLRALRLVILRSKMRVVYAWLSLGLTLELFHALECQ